MLQCTIWLLFFLGSPLISCFAGMLFRYSLSDSEMVPVAPIITGTTFPFTFHMRSVYIIRSLYTVILSAPFLITFLSTAIGTSINMHVPCLLSRIMLSGLFLGIVLLVYNCWFYNMVTLPSWLVSTNFGTCSYHSSLSNFTPISWHLLECS